MSRTLSTALTTEIAKTSNVHPRTLVTLFLDGGTVRFTDHDTDLVFQGNTYTARQFTHSAIKTFFSNKVDNCNISIDNTDLGMSAYYAVERFAGRRADVVKVFVDSAGDIIDGTKNLLTVNQAGVETDLTGLVSGHYLVAPSTIARNAGVSYHGGACVQISAGGDATGVELGGFSAYPAASAGQPYAAQARIKGTLGDAFRIYVGFFDAGDNVLSYYIIPIVATGEWDLASVSHISPVNTAKVTIAVNRSGASANDFYVDCLQVEQSDHATPFGLPTDDDQLLQFSGFMDTPKITEQNLAVRIVSIFDRSRSLAPWRLFQSKCNWDFCSAGFCTYNGNAKVRGTANSGTATGLTDTALVGVSTMVGALVKILSGTNKGAVRYIATHNTGTGAITWNTAMAAACDTTTAFLIECDKSRSACEGFSNEANFGGFDEQLYFKNLFVDQPTLQQYAHTYDKQIISTSTAIPLVYGRALVPGVLLDEHLYYPLAATWGLASDRIYAIGEGEISSVEAFSVNGVMAYEGGVSNYVPVLTFDMGYDFYAGAAGQTFAFHSDTKYYPKTAVARIELLFFGGNVAWEKDGLSNETDAERDASILNRDYRRDSVVFHVKGLKVQKYLANGTTDGAAAWSDNPIWCLLDFVMNRSMQRYTAAQIDFARVKAAADLCDTLGYRLNLKIDARTDEAKIIDWMQTACRGFLTYSAGKMAANVETTGSVAHAFTMANIVNDSFNGPYEEELNDRPNRVIVKYIDSEIRQNVALSTADIAAGVNIVVLAYGDKKGTFPATGTVYVGQEAVAYTADSGSALTINWTPVKSYQKGYPIFQGTQLFPEKTAVYNDWDDQDEKKRTVDKEIDGRGIPTYDQAYQVAEYIGRKQVAGNVFIKFRGMMDSLAVAVGDVASITHDVPGWTAEEFRVIEAAETQDEEIDYTCEVYDPSFYTQNNVNPGVILSTTLPNPYASPSHVTGVTLVEGGFLGQDGTYVPTVTVTYTLPTGDSSIFWDHAVIQVKIGAGDYAVYGNDQSSGVGFVVQGPQAGFIKGDTVYVKVISVNDRGIMADSTTAPTQSTSVAATIITLTTPADLALEGGGTSWNGIKAAFSWTPMGTGELDPSYVNNEVIIATGGVDRIAFYTKDNRWEYVYGDGIASALDSHIVTANGAFTIKVRRTSALVASSAQATLAVTNAAPGNPANSVIQALPRGASLTWDKSTETDFKEYQVRTKITSGGTFGSWIPIQDNTYTRMLTATEIGTYGKTPAIYFEVKTLDLYGNASSATAANVASIYYGITNLDVDDISADKITVGSLRGINVQAGTFMTKGSYLTAAASAADGTLNVKDTTDFAASGSGWIVDTTNDQDAFSWTGKTATTLTGCSGVLAHNNGAVVLPNVKAVIIDSAQNEIRFFGGRGDATILQVGRIGESAGTGYIEFGSTSAGWARKAIVGLSHDETGVRGESYHNSGVVGISSYGSGVQGYSYSLYGGTFEGALAPLYLVPSASASAPTGIAATGSLWVTSAGVLYINTSAVSPGTTWTKVGAQ